MTLESVRGLTDESAERLAVGESSNGVVERARGEASVMLDLAATFETAASLEATRDEVLESEPPRTRCKTASYSLQSNRPLHLKMTVMAQTVMNSGSQITLPKSVAAKPLTEVGGGNVFRFLYRIIGEQ